VISTFELGTDDQIEGSLEKKTNAKAADWSDVGALYGVLHDPRRTGADPTAWRTELGVVFDVDAFLEWLGIGVFVGHIDTYGVEAVSFYLYDDPATGRIT